MNLRELHEYNEEIYQVSNFSLITYDLVNPEEYVK